MWVNTQSFKFYALLKATVDIGILSWSQAKNV